MAYILGYVINNGNTGPDNPDVPVVNPPVINIQSSRLGLYTDQNEPVALPLGVSIENPVEGVEPTFTATGLPAGLEIQNGYIVGNATEAVMGTATIIISYPGAANKEIYVDYEIYALPSIEDPSPKPEDKEYKYTVSGAGDSNANGDYWATGETVKVSTSFVDPNDRYNTIQKDTEYPIYTNGTYYIVPNGGVGQYIIDDAVTPNGAPNYRGPSLITGTLSGDVCIANTPADGSWEVLGGTAPAPTVTEYSEGGDTPGTDDKTYVYTASRFNDGKTDGDYYLTDLTYDGYPVYSNGTMYLYYGDHWGTGLAWALNEYGPGNGPIKYYLDREVDLIGTNTWQADLGDYTITGTFTEYAG
jgi:hypothetical protein